MKKIYLTLLLMFIIPAVPFSQTVTELVVPQYIGCKNANTSNNARTAFAVCIKIDGLVPNTSYDVRAGIGLVSNPATSYGAGNVWYNNTFQAVNMYNYFMTDAAGSSGPVWIIYQPTGNSSRFDAGQQHNIRIGYTINGNSMPGSPSYVGSKIITALDIPVTPRTTSTDDDGAFVKGSAMPSASGKYVLLFDNVNGTGDPLFAYMIRQAVPTQVANTQLPAEINDIYMQTGTSAVGDYPAVIPIGANNPAGVRRIEARNDDNSLYAYNTDADGIWPSGGNTTNPQRRDVVIITNTDAPLVPLVLGPTVTTSPVTNINYNSATGGGDVTSDGGGTITARGVCWSTNHNPTTADDHTTEPGTTGPFTSVMTGLAASTAYYVRAFATNATATSYGAEESFITLCDPYPPVPGFWASNTNPQIGQPVNFYDSTIFCPTSWNWSFVGGTPATSTAQNPTGIVYNYPGVFNVCLTATNNYGSQTTCKMGYIVINGPTDSKVVISEIMYNPPEAGTDSLEYVELYNNDTSPVDLKDYYFSEGVVFTFPTYVLDPGEYVLVAKSYMAMAQTFGVPALQWTSGALSNSGELVRLKDRYGFTVDSVNYQNVLPWDTMANGRGPSLELCDPNVNNALGENWRHGLEFRAVNAAGDSIWGSPYTGCAFLPVADFSADNTAIPVNGYVNFTDQSTGIISEWHWDFEGGNPSVFSAQTPPPVQYTEMGTFDVSLTVSNIAGESKKVMQGYIEVGATGVGKSGDARIFSVYPNPSQGKFSLIMTQGSSCNVRIFSPLGMEILNVDNEGNKQAVDLTGQPSGIYLVQVTEKLSGNCQTRKIMIE